MQNNSAQNFLSQGISRFSTSLFLAVTLAVLAGCGSGGSGGTPASTSAAGTATGTTGTTGTTNTAPTGTLATSIELLVGSSQLPSSGKTTVALRAVVLSATGQTVPGRTVVFSRGTDTAFFTDITPTGGVSDANGIVTANLNLGGDQTNRRINLTATADAVTGKSSVDVTGTNISIAGITSLSVGGNPSKLTITVKDSAGAVIPGVLLSVVSTTGNTIAFTPGSGITCASASTCKTDNSGQLIANVTATVATSPDTITVLGAGAVKTQDLTINSANFIFTQPAALAAGTSVDIALNTSTKVAIKWTNIPPIPAGTQVNFSTTRGTITNLTPDCSAPSVAPGGVAVTDGAGNACASITSALAGPANITAAGQPPITSPAVTGSVAFVTLSAANVTVQAVPGTVAVTIAGSASQTNNTSTITAVVRDTAGDLVKNAAITFTLTDLTGGTLSSGTATTDVSGSASVTYTAGGTSSAQNGVIIRATVTGITNALPGFVPVSSGVVNFPDATLTVANQPLLVALGTDNKVITVGTNNQRIYSAVVSDAAGNGSAGTTVRFALRPSRFAKGFFVQGTPWAQNFTTPDPTIVGSTDCANEDKNFNGILDPGEDLNGNGKLDPGAPATVTGSAVTDANGIATATVTYPKSFAFWAEVTLEARTGVVGNDPPTTTTFFLLGLAADYADKTVQPPGVLSPYGISNSCLDKF